MSTNRLYLKLALLAVGILGAPALDAAAQPLGAFYWQLAPFCNVVALHITQYVTPPGAVYALTGFDDQCGAADRATVVGTATFNHDGSIGLGLTIVTTPTGTPVHVDARVSLSSLTGPWSDSAGNTGTFVPLSAAVGDSLRDRATAAAGTPRPVPPNGIAPGSITAQQLAPGAIGGGQIDPNQVQARVIGTCPVGQYLRGIHAAGTVLCEPLLTPNVSASADVPGTAGSPTNTSIAIGADGLPVISHYVVGASGLRVTHCGNASCSAGNVSTTVDDPANTVGVDSSIAIGTDGLPVINHWNNTAQALQVTHCGNVGCDIPANNLSTTVDDPDDTVGAFTSIAIGADGLPVISHYDSTVGALRVTHCGDVTCSSATQNIATNVDDPPNDVGWYTSIAVGADGLPIISHYDNSAGALRVTHCGTRACNVAATNVSTTVDDPANSVGTYTSIAIGADSLPVISYRDATAGALRVTHCGTVDCSVAAQNVSTTVDDSTHDVGYYTSIGIGADGLPVISHWDFTAAALRVTHCGNPACSAGNVSTTVDDPPNTVGIWTSIAIGADGLPVISHVDSTVQGIRVTKCATRTCQ